MSVLNYSGSHHWKSSGLWICWISKWGRCWLCNQGFKYDKAIWKTYQSE